MKRILIVESDEALAAELTEMLKEYLVVTVPSTITAWVLIEEGPPFDLVITDIDKISETSGVQLLRSMKAQSVPSTCVLMSSGTHHDGQFLPDVAHALGVEFMLKSSIRIRFVLPLVERLLGVTRAAA
jgi:DNA-binding NtrC family response regulator